MKVVNDLNVGGKKTKTKCFCSSGSYISRYIGSHCQCDGDSTNYNGNYNKAH